MKKIALIIPTLEGGGAERIASTISLNLGHLADISIIVFHDKEVAYPYYGRIINAPDNKNPANKFTKLITLYKRFLFIKKYKRENGIDIALSFMPVADVFNILTRVREEVIVSVHNYADVAEEDFVFGNTAIRKLIKFVTKILYVRADTVVVVSMSIKERLIEAYKIAPEKIRVVYNPSDVGKISKMCHEALESDMEELFNGIVFITAGRLSEQKSQFHLIRAFSKVKSILNDSKLVVMGSGDLENQLKKLVADLNLEKSVFFIGFRQNPFKYIKRSSIFVLCSVCEGFGNVIVEALCCGVPVISTDCLSGPREILAPGISYGGTLDKISFEKYGVLIPVCDGIFRSANIALTKEEELMANAMIELYLDKEKMSEYIRNSKERVKELDISAIMPIYEKLLL